MYFDPTLWIVCRMGSVSFVEACTRLFSPVSLPTWMNELFMWRHRFLENLSFHLSQRFLCSWDRMRKKKKQKTKNKKIKKQRNKETMKQRNNETKKQRNKSLDKKKFDYSQNKCGKYCSALNSQSILNLPSYWSRGVFFIVLVSYLPWPCFYYCRQNKCLTIPILLKKISFYFMHPIPGRRPSLWGCMGWGRGGRRTAPARPR